jgi:protein disulfide-isomerase A1
VIAEVDATVAENVSSQLGVQGYPSLKFIVEGNVIDYAGDRSASFMQGWIEKLIKAEIKQVTEDELKSLIGT